MWLWFESALIIARGWTSSLTTSRDVLSGGAPGSTDPLPGPPVLPAVPLLPVPPGIPVVIEHDFFDFFTGLVSGIKKNQHYDPADGKLLGIEGTPIPPPVASVVPMPTVELMTGGHPGAGTKNRPAFPSAFWNLRPSGSSAAKFRLPQLAAGVGMIAAELFFLARHCG